MTKPPVGAKKSSQRRYWWSRNWFYTAIIVIAVIGAFCAFYLPLHISEQFSAGDNVASLRQAILVATGGTIAMLTLWETRRKNLQEKDKNDLDHARQVKAERRSRYAKAIEQLADDKSAVRLGGIYTLVKLADEWLSDVKTMPSESDRTDEAQIIINSLCAYIRSPFSLATKRAVFENSSTSISSVKNSKILMNKFFKSQQVKEEDKISLREEQEIRRTIFEEIEKRLIKVQGPRIREIGSTNIIGTLNKGLWYNLMYNFSNAPIFYPLNDLQFKSPNFAGAKFYGSTNFSLSEFHGTPNFENAEFMGESNFYGTAFHKAAKFAGAIFNESAIFESSTFRSSNEMTLEASFELIDKAKKISTQRKYRILSADFQGAKFNGKSDFRSTVFEGPVNFKNSSFGQKLKKSPGSFADFTSANFKIAISFSGAHFYQDANFTSARFSGIADFTETIFDASSFFAGTIFLNTALFKKAIFSKYSPLFIASEYKGKYIYLASNTPSKYGRPIRAMFTSEPFKFEMNHLAKQKESVYLNHDFEVSESHHPIETEQVTVADGRVFTIPVGCKLFDPDSWDEEKQEYTPISDPAEPLDESDEVEEDKSE